VSFQLGKRRGEGVHEKRIFEVESSFKKVVSEDNRKSVE
jgi:hypothetical protein